jgi:hypothetical protein
MKAASLLSPLCKLHNVPVLDLHTAKANRYSCFNCPGPGQIHSPWNRYRILVRQVATMQASNLSLTITGDR